MAVLHSLNELKTLLADKPRRRMAVVAANDEHTLDATILARGDGLLDPVLLGPKKETMEILRRLNVEDAKTIELIDIDDPAQCAAEAVRLVRAGEVNCIMKGHIETGTLMKAVVNRETGIRKRETLSAFGLYEAKGYHKIFSVTDMGLMLYPNLEQKKAIIENAVDVLHTLGLECPKVAVLASVEKLNPKMTETVDAAALKEMNMNGEITGCVLEGPISYDLAMDPDAAKIKGYVSPVAGDADLLLVPDITAGNVLVKALTCTAGALTGGIMVGARVPIVSLSRAARAEDKYYSILVAVVAAEN